MYGFLLRPKWIAFHLLVVGAVVLMVSLGFWQLRRLDERREFNATVAARVNEPPVPLDELLAQLDGSDDAGDIESVQWRQVTAEGTWLDEQIIWFNRTQDGLAGDNVLTPLVEPSGTTVVVNRGFVPLGREIPAAPSGDVAVLARVRIPHVRQTGELTDATDGGAVTEVRRVDLDQLAGQLPGDVAPVYLDLVATDPAVTDADPTPLPMPDLNDGPHLSYAMQWFIFAACVAVGWVLAVRRSIGVRRLRAATIGAGDGGAAVATDGLATGDAPASVGDAPASAGEVSGAPAPPSDGTARSRSGSRDPDRASGTPSRH